MKPPKLRNFVDYVMLVVNDHNLWVYTNVVSYFAIMDTLCSNHEEIAGMEFGQVAMAGELKVQYMQDNAINESFYVKVSTWP